MGGKSNWKKNDIFQSSGEYANFYLNDQIEILLAANNKHRIIILYYKPSISL
jgi:hypothetical protein